MVRSAAVIASAAAAVLGAVAVTADTYLSITQPLDHSCTQSSCATFEQSYVWINDTGPFSAAESAVLEYSSTCTCTYTRVLPLVHMYYSGTRVLERYTYIYD